MSCEQLLPAQSARLVCLRSIAFCAHCLESGARSGLPGSTDGGSDLARAAPRRSRRRWPRRPTPPRSCARPSRSPASRTSRTSGTAPRAGPTAGAAWATRTTPSLRRKRRPPHRPATSSRRAGAAFWLVSPFMVHAYNAGRLLQGCATHACAIAPFSCACTGPAIVSCIAGERQDCCNRPVKNMHGSCFSSYTQSCGV